MLSHAWLQTLVYGFAGLGCAVIVFLIARCISKAYQDLKSFESYMSGKDDPLC